MKFIINSIKQYFKQPPKQVLGRWNVDYCDKKINNKIDLSNEDHCGPCGNYILERKMFNNKSENSFKDHT